MSKITIKDIRERYLSSKEKERKFKWTYYVRRPASYYLAWPFLRLGISATKVTMVWLAVAIIGCGFLVQGGYTNMIIGTVLLEFAVILDCVDGHIARFTRPTKTGDILDTWVGEILLVSSLFSIGIGLSNSQEQLVVPRIVPFLQINNMTFLYLGFLAALTALSSWTVRLHWRTITAKLGLNDGEPDDDIRGSKKVLILDNLFHYSGAITVLMVAASILFLMDVLLILIAAIYAMYLLSIMSKIIRKARRLDSARDIE